MPGRRSLPLLVVVALTVGSCTTGAPTDAPSVGPLNGASQGPQVTLDPSPSPSPSPSPPPSPGWTAACADTAVRSFLVDIAWDGQRLVGSARFWSDAVGASVAGAWVSDDGRSWRLVDLPYAQSTRSNEHPSSVATGPAGFVIGGSVGQSEGAIAWYSADGGDWERIVVGDGGAFGVTSGGGVYVLAGDTGLGGRPAIWWSTSGRDWRAASIEDGGRYGLIGSVIDGGPGFVAVGSGASEPGPDVTEPGVTYPHLRWAGVPWTSRDGRTWRRLDRPDAFEWATVTRVTRAGSVLYAFGWAGEPGRERVATVWRSDDGLDWRRLPEEPPGGEILATYQGLPDGRVLAIVGSGPAVTWVSRDGSDWSMADAPSIAGSEIASVATDGDGLLAVGSLAGDVDAGWRSPGCASVPIWHRTIASLDGR